MTIPETIQMLKFLTEYEGLGHCRLAGWMVMVVNYELSITNYEV